MPPSEGPEQFLLNGEPHPLPRGGSFAGLLASLEIPMAWVIVELNGEPVSRSLYPGLRLSPGDRLEIATPMAGG